MLKHSLKAAGAVLSIVLGLSVVTASAQPILQGTQTCTAAYGKCFDYCAAQYPAGREKSAKCVDQCFVARAECDRGGCFKFDAVEVCQLQQR